MLPIETYYPRNELLKKHISYYYFLRTDSVDFNAAYCAFPNNVHALNIHKNVSCIISGQSVLTAGVKEKNHTLILQSMLKEPLYVQLKGILDKITIIFKPTGLSPFIKHSFSELAVKPTQLFNEWDHDEGFKFLHDFFAVEDQEERINILETFLLKLYAPLEKQELLDRSIRLLCDFNASHTISEVARMVDLPERTFLRLFQKHTGVTPVAYRKISRFRQSLKNKLFNAKFKKLTAVSYESNFYDQAYFIKIYNQMAGANPGKFFNSVDTLADDHLVFRFAKK